jgi:hypothetical protein
MHLEGTEPFLARLTRFFCPRLRGEQNHKTRDCAPSAGVIASKFGEHIEARILYGNVLFFWTARLHLPARRVWTRLHTFLALEPSDFVFFFLSFAHTF